jgi:hypothetical protein
MPKTQTGEKFIKEGHLRYELDMLMFAFHKIPYHSPEWVNVHLEIFLLHARNLIEFIRKNKKGVAYKATLYQSEIDSLDCQDFIGKYYSAICMQLSHPSDERIKGYKWDNSFPEIYDGIFDNYKKLFSIHNIDLDAMETKIMSMEDTIIEKMQAR